MDDRGGGVYPGGEAASVGAAFVAGLVFAGINFLWLSCGLVQALR